MSRIYWHGQHHESELLGRERAYMGLLPEGIAREVVGRSLGGEHPIARILPSGVTLPAYKDIDYAVHIYLSGLIDDGKLVWGGQTHNVGDLVLNTAIATGSPYLALLARLHGYCESHAWVAEKDREWLAGIIDGGRAVNIFRPDMGWESVAEHLRNGDGGPVVTSYSVCDGFPSNPPRWMDEAWPPEQIGKWDYAALTAEQKKSVDDKSDSWYDIPTDEQWRIAFDALQKDWWLQLTPENLTQPMFSGTATLWDAVASPEYRGEVADNLLDVHLTHKALTA